MKATKATVHLGFEVDTGEPVSIPLRHMVVTGQTQEAGKTTTLEALIARANLPAVAFITKRGEKSFSDGRRIAPYFRERADWQFVASVMEAAMRERLKFERAWIMRASKGAKTLQDVHRNVREQMKTAKGLNADVYMQLDEYLNIVVPRIAQVHFAEKLDLEPGLNVLDLSDRDRFPPELQGLVMRSALEWIYEKCDGTIAIIPEAWEFLPQQRGSPVKLAAVELIRKGAGLKNYVWLDSQDIGGVDKEMLRSCPVWLLGVQRETNEIKRVLENIPEPTRKPKPSDVARLKKGQFYACFGDTIVKTYVQPAWMDAAEAQAIARGTVKIDQAKSKPNPPPKEAPMSANVEKKLDQLIDVFSAFAKNGMAEQRAVDGAVASAAEPRRAKPADLAPMPDDEEALYQRFKARLMTEAPKIIQVLAVVPEIEIQETVERLQADGKSLRGRVVSLIARGFMDNPISGAAVVKELKRTGTEPNSGNVHRDLGFLVALGFLTKENEGYRIAPGAKSRIVK